MHSTNIYYIPITLGWPQSSFGLFHTSFWKKLTKLFGQPSISSTLGIWEYISERPDFALIGIYSYERKDKREDS